MRVMQKTSHINPPKLSPTPKESMLMSKSASVLICILVGLVLTPAMAMAETTVPGAAAAALRDVQQYNFAIHILRRVFKIGF